MSHKSDRNFFAAILVGAAIAGGLAGCVIGYVTQPAHGAELGVTLRPPTVAGIEDHGPRYSPYPGPRRQYAPSAGIVRLWEEVPATPCGAAFEVISGPRAARGCLR